MAYFSGQGLISIGTGAGIAEYEVGNAPGISIDLATDVVEHTESTSGQRLVDFRLTKASKATIKITLEDWSLDNLALGLYGQAAARAAGTVTGESLGTVVAGALYPLQFPLGVSAVVVRDSSSTPVVVPAVNYTVDDIFGTLTFHDVSGLTMPLKVDYAYGAGSNIAMFQVPPAPRFVRARLRNTANGNAASVVELYRVQFDPIKSLSLISNDLGQLELTGSVLADPGKASDATFGMFGRMIIAG